MTLIDQGGKRVRLVCGRCHRVRVKIRRGATACEDCREPERKQYAETKAMAEWVKRYQAELQLIDTGQVQPACMVCGSPGNRPNFASARASGKTYRCDCCRADRRKVAR